MYIDIVPNRQSKPTVLLREATRVGKKIVKRTIANISHWPPEKIAACKLLLADVPLIRADQAFTPTRTLPHGHVEAILGSIKRLQLDRIISSLPSRERNLVLAMIVERLIKPCSKLATTRLWHSTTLAEGLDVADADEAELYKAMDWLLSRQRRIENKLAARHLTEGSLVLYDVTRSTYEGRTCPLAEFGFNPNGKKGRRVIVYGVLCDREGRPLGVTVYPGKTGDALTMPDQVTTLIKDFKLERVVVVGDRGMITQTQLETIRKHPGLGWISALRSSAIKRLVADSRIQMSLFDEHNLAEITSPDYPGERLIACYNPLLAEHRRQTREDLLRATEKDLMKLVREVTRRTRKPLTKAEIGFKAGKKINHYKMGKHFKLSIGDNFFAFVRHDRRIVQEQLLDGLYVIRTSEPADRLSAADTVRSYKSLAQVERLFRTVKGLALLVSPIHHRAAVRVRAHIFICLLAYYVEWHMRKALAPLLFDDEALPTERWQRDPVSPAQSSALAKRKKKTLTTADGFPIHSFDTLMEELGTRARNTYRTKEIPGNLTFATVTDMTPLQTRAFQLLGLFPVK